MAMCCGLIFPSLVHPNPGAITDYRAEAYRTLQSIEIDGDFNETDWQNAIPILQLVQMEPDEGASITEPTEVRILYDDQNLYFGFTCYDSDMSKLVANDMRRDAQELYENDNVFLLLDTYNDRRSGFFFRVNPLGAMEDAAISNSGDTQNQDWNAVWNCRAKINDRYWTAEISIPFSQLRFNQSQQMSWGMNVGRAIRRNQEEAMWFPVSQAYGFMARYRTSNLGELTGLEGITPSRRLEFLPYLLPGVSRARDDDDGSGKLDTDSVFDVGLDLKYGITSNVTADVTFNTDFAQVESDQEQVNLTRFSLFFPEKRPFFLEGAGLFDFGIPRQSFRRPPPLLLFYSRQIGLEEGNPVPIIAGGKVTGKVGSYSLGLLNVFTNDFFSIEDITDPDDDINAPKTNYSVLRLKRDMWGSSSIGLIAVNKQDRDTYNRAGGADFSYRPVDSWNIRGLYARTAEEGISEKRDAWYIGSNWRSDVLRVSGTYTDIGENFNPEVGFLRRTGRQVRGEMNFTPRPGRFGIRQIWTGPEFDLIYNDSGQLESREATYSTWFSFERGGWIFFRGQNFFERLDEDFAIHEEKLFDINTISELQSGFKSHGTTLPDTATIEKTHDRWAVTDAENNRQYIVREEDNQLNVYEGVIPIGEYEFNSFGVTFQTDETKMLSSRFGINIGDFYNGTRRGFDFEIKFKPSGRFSVEPQYEFNRLSLPSGSFNANVFGARVNYSFSTLLFAKVFAQWNTDDDMFSSNFLINYIYRPGSDFFFVFNQIYDASDNQVRLEDSTVVAKMTYWWNP